MTQLCRSTLDDALLSSNLEDTYQDNILNFLKIQSLICLCCPLRFQIVETREILFVLINFLWASKILICIFFQYELLEVTYDLLNNSPFGKYKEQLFLQILWSQLQVAWETFWSINYLNIIFRLIYYKKLLPFIKYYLNNKIY